MGNFLETVRVVIGQETVRVGMWSHGMNLDGNKGLRSSSLNYVVKQKID